MNTHIHEQVEIDGILVDRNLAPILRQLWRLGFDTVMSCQDNVPSGYAWISFCGREDGFLFVSILFEVLPAMRPHDDIRIRFTGRTHKCVDVRFPNKYLVTVTRQLKKLWTKFDSPA